MALAKILWNTCRDTVCALAITESLPAADANAFPIDFAGSVKERRPWGVTNQNDSRGIAQVELSFALERLQFMENLMRSC